MLYSTYDASCEESTPDGNQCVWFISSLRPYPFQHCTVHLLSPHALPILHWTFLGAATIKGFFLYECQRVLYFELRFLVLISLQGNEIGLYYTTHFLSGELWYFRQSPGQSGGGRIVDLGTRFRKIYGNTFYSNSKYYASSWTYPLYCPVLVIYSIQSSCGPHALKY